MLNNLNTHHLVTGLALRTLISDVHVSMQCASLWWLHISDFYFSLFLFFVIRLLSRHSSQTDIVHYLDTTTTLPTLWYTMPHTVQMYLIVSSGIFSSPFIVVIAPQVLCSVHIFQLPAAAAASCCYLDLYLLPLPFTFFYFVFMSTFSELLIKHITLSSHTDDNNKLQYTYTSKQKRSTSMSDLYLLSGYSAS